MTKNLDKTAFLMYVIIMVWENKTQVNHDKILTDNYFIGFVTELIRNSVDKIFMTLYYINIHTTWKSCEIKTLLDEIMEKQKQGLEVKLLFNRPTEKNILHHGLMDSFEYLKQKGVPVKRTSQERTTHAKLILCDGNKIVIGSHNFSLTSLHKNREISIYVENEILCKQLEVYFLENYYNALSNW